MGLPQPRFPKEAPECGRRSMRGGRASRWPRRLPARAKPGGRIRQGQQNQPSRLTQTPAYFHPSRREFVEGGAAFAFDANRLSSEEGQRSTGLRFESKSNNLIQRREGDG